MPLIPALGRQRQVDLCEFEASLDYRVSSRAGSTATEKPCLEKQTKKTGMLVSNQGQLAYLTYPSGPDPQVLMGPFTPLQGMT